jgi:hypothetical protein
LDGAAIAVVAAAVVVALAILPVLELGLDLRLSRALRLLRLIGRARLAIAIPAAPIAAAIEIAAVEAAAVAAALELTLLPARAHPLPFRRRGGRRRGRLGLAAVSARTHAVAFLRQRTLRAERRQGRQEGDQGDRCLQVFHRLSPRRRSFFASFDAKMIEAI